MRELLHETLADTRSFVGDLVGTLRADRRLTDDEVLAQYSTIRGNVPALIQFAERQVAAGDDPLQEALRYEKEMEALIRKREREV